MAGIPLHGSRRPRGQPSLSASARGHLQGTGGSQPHVTWWGEEGIPRVGGTVQVLHEDGIWYPGMLTSCEGSKWHIHFEDGDQDVYTLPHRDVKVMRQRPASGEEWTNFLKSLNIPSSSQTREVLRDAFCRKAQQVAPPRSRKPSETYNEDGTPKDFAASSLPPFPDGEGSDAGGEGLYAQAGMSAGSAGSALLNFSNFLGQAADGGRSRKRTRRGFELQLSEGIRGRYPEAKLYAQLQELERKIDSISTRKRMQVEEALKHPGTCTRRLQIIVWNTHENQVLAEAAAHEHDEVASTSAGTLSSGATPSWTLFITARLVDGSGDEVAGEGQASLSSLLERVFVELPAQLYPDSHAIEWNRWDGGSKRQKEVKEGQGAPPPAAPSGFSIKREGAQECKVRVMLHCTSDPKRFSLSGNPELGDLLGFESGSWSELLAAFWAYVQDNSLHSDDDVLHIKLDDPLQKIFGEERLALRRVSERLSEMATQEQPIEIVYSLKLHGEAKPLVYEALVQVQDPVMTHMRELVQSISQPQSAAAEHEHDEQIARLVSEVETRKRRRDFMASLAERPLPFLHDVVCGLALDLATVRSEGSSRFGGLGQDNLERSPAWQQPWTEEAVLHYLNMQGYHVPLKMEDSLLEEDANALAQQDAAVKYGGILSKEALARNPPYIPGSTGGSGGTRGPGRPAGAGAGNVEEEGNFKCEPCNRRFKSHHALSVHFATSAAHKNEKDELKASGWKAENAVGAADAGAGMAGASGMAALANQNAAAGLAAAGLDAKERGATVWNDLQRQMKGKGFTQEELKNMYSELRKHDNA